MKPPNVGEEWRDIDGTGGFYRVSNLGRVWSVRRKGARGYGRTGRALSGFRGNRGHRYVILCYCNRKLARLVHRLVLEAFVGPCPTGMECRHLDGNSENNSVENLAWGTHAENCADTVKHGKTTRGERCPSAKLTEDAALAILDSKEPHAALAQRYGISTTVVSGIQHRRLWKHLSSHRETPVVDLRFSSRSSSGTSNPNATLTDEAVLEIFDSPEQAAAVAQKHGVTASTIWGIRNGRAWTHVTKNRPKPERPVFNKGSHHPKAKLTEDAVIEILDSQESQAVLAKRHGVHQSMISHIKRRKNWRHLANDQNSGVATKNEREDRIS